MKKLLLLVSALLLPALAVAADAMPGSSLASASQGFAGGFLNNIASALSILALLSGGAIGALRKSVVPVFGGITSALLLTFAPVVVSTLFYPNASDVDGPANVAAVAEVAHVASSTIAASATAVPPLNAASSSAVMQASAAVTTVPALASSSAVASAVAATSVPPVSASSATETTSLTVTATTAAPVPDHPVVAASNAAVGHGAGLPDPAPVPMATKHTAAPPVDVKAAGSSNVMTWLGGIGAVVIAALLGLLWFASSRRKPASQPGFSSSARPATGAGLGAFSDPHGFARQKSTSSLQP